MYVCITQEDLQLLKNGLAHIAAHCSSHPTWAPKLLGPSLLSLLRLDRLYVRSEIRRWIFTAIQNTCDAVDQVGMLLCVYHTICVPPDGLAQQYNLMDDLHLLSTRMESKA